MNIVISCSGILWELSQLGRTWHSVKKLALQHSVGESAFVCWGCGPGGAIMCHAQSTTLFTSCIMAECSSLIS